MMTLDEITALGEDIKNNGLKQPIVVIKTPDGDALLDGRNRLDAMASVGLITDLNLIEHRVLDAGTDPFAFAISANIYRRHLTADQRRDLIAKVLKTTPDASNRQIAGQVKASPTTVGVVRRELEATDQIGQLKKRTGKDGKARTTTPRKQAPPPRNAPAPEPASAPEDDFPEMPAFLLRGKLGEPNPDEPEVKAIKAARDAMPLPLKFALDAFRALSDNHQSRFLDIVEAERRLLKPRDAVQLAADRAEALATRRGAA